MFEGHYGALNSPVKIKICLLNTWDKVTNGNFEEEWMNTGQLFSVGNACQHIIA